MSVNPNLDIPLIVAVAGNPPVLHFLSFGDGGRTVRWLGKMPAPEFAGGWVRARWSPDGRRIFLGGGGATAVVITPCNLSAVSPYLGELCRGKTEDDVQKIGDGVHAVGFGAWTADGKDVVTNSYLGHPNVWNAATGALDRGLLDQIPLRPEENDSLTCLAISPSGHSFAEGDRSGSIVIVNEQSKAGSHLGPQPGFGPNQICFNPANETEVVAISQNKTILWQTGMSESVNLPHNYASVMQAAFDPKGRFLVTGANDGTVRLWMLDRGRRSPLIIRSSRSSFADIMARVHGRCGTGWHDHLRLRRRFAPVLANGCAARLGAGRGKLEAAGRRQPALCRLRQRTVCPGESNKALRFHGQLPRRRQIESTGVSGGSAQATG